MMASRPATPPTDGGGGGGGGGDAKTAQKLLKPRRRQQIEVWLDEAVHWERSQSCAVGSSFGHDPADLPGPTSGPSQPSLPSPSAHPCQVCGRCSTGEVLPTTSSATTQPSSPGGPRDEGDNPGRAKQMFRGVMNALRITGSDRGDESVRDPALSTRMFLVEATKDDGSGSESSVASRFSSGGGEQALDGRMARLRRAQKLLEKSQPKVG